MPGGSNPLGVNGGAISQLYRCGERLYILRHQMVVALAATILGPWLCGVRLCGPPFAYQSLEQKPGTGVICSFRRKLPPCNPVSPLAADGVLGGGM